MSPTPGLPLLVTVATPEGTETLQVTPLNAPEPTRPELWLCRIDDVPTHIPLRHGDILTADFTSSPPMRITLTEKSTNITYEITAMPLKHLTHASDLAEQAMTAFHNECVKRRIPYAKNREGTLTVSIPISEMGTEIQDIAMTVARESSGELKHALDDGAIWFMRSQHVHPNDPEPPISMRTRPFSH